jgi:hypothetical protein
MMWNSKTESRLTKRDEIYATKSIDRITSTHRSRDVAQLLKLGELQAIKRSKFTLVANAFDLPYVNLNGNLLTTSISKGV